MRFRTFQVHSPPVAFTAATAPVAPTEPLAQVGPGFSRMFTSTPLAL
ncbi:MAG TPA: hypothetical protein VHA75_02725 [Rugosimonospora sp.]|nr:hypothetical protein [Rugosimonospora sp.]